MTRPIPLRTVAILALAYIVVRTLFWNADAIRDWFWRVLPPNEMPWTWWLVGFVCGLWLLLNKKFSDWKLLPVMVALGPLTVLFYLAALIVAAIRKGEA